MPIDAPTDSAAGPNGVIVILLCLVTTVTMSAIAVPLIIAGLNWRDDTRPLDGGVSTEGRIVRVIEDDDTYRAVVGYADAGGARHQITNKSGNEKPAVGDVVRISYDPADPALAHDLTTGQGTWKLPFGTGVSIIGFGVLIDVIVAIVIVRQRRAAQPL